MINVKWTQLQEKCPKHDLKKDNTNKHCMMDRGKPQEPSILHRESQAAKNAESWGNNLPQRRTHDLFIQHQRVNPEHIFIQITYTASGREARWCRKVWGKRGKEKQIQV